MTDDTKVRNDGVTNGGGASAKDQDGGSAAFQESAPPTLEQLMATEKERDDMKDALLRALAETDNVRKRSNREIGEARLYAVEKFARDLLSVADNLARAAESVAPESRAGLPEAARVALEGVDLTQKELVAILGRHGVTPIAARPGDAFDPLYHQAVTQVPSEHPAGTVAQLFQSGWKIGDRTLRAAMVAVSAGGGGMGAA